MSSMTSPEKIVAEKSAKAAADVSKSATPTGYSSLDLDESFNFDAELKSAEDNMKVYK